MKTKSLFAIAILLMAVSSTVSVQAASRRDLQRLIETGRCPRCDLRNADLDRANLRNANLEEADLRGATLRRASLQGANLRNADLTGADLRDADLRNANLRNASFRDANLRNASLDGAEIRGLELSGADVRGTNLRESDVRSNRRDRYDRRRNEEDGRIALELFSRGGDDVKIVIEGDGDRREVHFGPALTKERIYLSPSLYRLRFFNGSGSKLWMSGKLDLERRRTDTIRIYFNRRDRSVVVENDPKAWNSD